MVDVPAAPILATVPRVEIASVGWWNISNATDWHPSSEDLAAAVAALDCPAVRRPTLKFGHTGAPGEGDPSIGLIDNLSVTDDGQTLVGDFVGVPAWLADADDEGRSVIASAYPDRSGEFQHDYVCQLGHTHPFVVHAVALLGVVRPGIGTLESLYDLYAKAPQKEEPVMAKAALASTTVDQVRKAYYAGPGTNWSLWIRELFIDPPELIVQDDADDSVIGVPYTVSGEGDVEFGDPQPVKVEYVAARTGLSKPVVAFASHAESRPNAAQNSSAAEVGVTEKEGPMATLQEALVERLGIPADADEETTIAALDEALAERASETPEPGTETAPAEPTAEQVAASAQRLGLTLVDRQQYEETVAAAAEGRQARQQQLRDADESLVSAAIRDGKFPPARRDHWLASLAADREGTTATIESLAKGLIPVAEVGHGQDVGNETDLSNYSWPGTPASKEA